MPSCGKKSTADAADRLLTNILRSWPLLEPVHMFAAIATPGQAGPAIDTLLAAKPSVRDVVDLERLEKRK